MFQTLPVTTSDLGCCRARNLLWPRVQDYRGIAGENERFRRQRMLARSFPGSDYRSRLRPRRIENLNRLPLESVTSTRPPNSSRTPLRSRTRCPYDAYPSSVFQGPGIGRGDRLGRTNHLGHLEGVLWNRSPFSSRILEVGAAHQGGSNPDP
jgi:hypothetical protein